MLLRMQHEHHPGCGHVEELSEAQFHELAEHMGHICSELCIHSEQAAERPFELREEVVATEIPAQPLAETPHRHHHDSEARFADEKPAATEMLWQAAVQEKLIIDMQEQQQQTATFEAVSKPAEQAVTALISTPEQAVPPAKQSSSAENLSETVQAKINIAVEDEPATLANELPEIALPRLQFASETVEDDLVTVLPEVEPLFEVPEAYVTVDKSTEPLSVSLEQTTGETIEPMWEVQTAAAATFETDAAATDQITSNDIIEGLPTITERLEIDVMTVPKTIEQEPEEVPVKVSVVSTEKVEPVPVGEAVSTVLSELDALVSKAAIDETSRLLVQEKLEQLIKILGVSEPSEIVKTLLEDFGLTAQDKILLELFELLSHDKRREGRSRRPLFKGQLTGSLSKLGKMVLALLNAPGPKPSSLIY